MKPVSTSNITMPITYVAGLVVAIFAIYNMFVLKVDAEAAHDKLGTMINLSRLESNLGLARNSLTFMEQAGMNTPGQLRDYELLKSSVEYMTNQELELRK